MAAFAAFFPWCSPEVFWRLTIDEHAALMRVIEESQRGQ